MEPLRFMKIAVRHDKVVKIGPKNMPVRKEGYGLTLFFNRMPSSAEVDKLVAWINVFQNDDYTMLQRLERRIAVPTGKGRKPIQ